MSFVTFPLADSPPVSHAIGWITLGILLIAGLAVGFSDVRRLQFRRIWALSGVCFTESMRRRVLLVTPLAIAGLVVVCQLQQASDPQDAIRQTAKYCVFASGMVVVISALILACTNLPREIENRIIYTIVTKPTTRLEIVLGKVLGFARVSAAILLVMGVFSYIYLETRNHFRVEAVKAQLATTPADAADRATLQHYADRGFLETRSLDLPSDMNLFARPPADGLGWIRGARPQYFLVHFAPSEPERAVLAAASQAGVEVDVVTSLRVQWRPLTASEQVDAQRTKFPLLHPLASQPFGPSLAQTAPSTKPTEYAPILNFRLVDSADRQLVDPEEMGADAGGLHIVDSEDGKPSGVFAMPSKVVAQLAEIPEFYVEVASQSPGVEYGANANSVVLFIPSANNGKGMTIHSPALNGQPEQPKFLGRPGRAGIVLSDATGSNQSVAIFGFRGASPAMRSNQTAAFQLNVNIERAGDGTDLSQSMSVAQLTVVNLHTGKSSGPILVTPEINRMTFFDVPAEDVEGGDFDVQLREMTSGQWLDLQPDSVVLITADGSFSANLFKSFLLLWMLSVLVVAISVFCSTFLSWPIAIVLALVLLLGHWGVAELGDALNPGVGHTISNEFLVRDPTGSKVVSSSVEALARTLRTVSLVLPDVSQFPATDDLPRGVSISLTTLGAAAEALLIYGLSVVLGGYLILRYKEVAP